MSKNRGRRQGPYTAKLGGNSWSRGPEDEFTTIREARQWAEGYGCTADWCSIYNAGGALIAEHLRDTSSNRWFRAEVGR